MARLGKRLVPRLRGRGAMGQPPTRRAPRDRPDVCERETHFRRHECTQSTLLSDSNQVVQAECHLVASCPLKVNSYSASSAVRRNRGPRAGRWAPPPGPECDLYDTLDLSLTN